MKTLIILLLVISVNGMSASIDVVVSGQRFDGIHRMQNGDFLATTAELGQVIRFNSQGDQSELLNGGTYFFGVTEDSEGNIYTTDGGTRDIIKISLNGQQEILTTSINGPTSMTEAPDGTFYVGSRLGGVYQLSKTGNSDLLINENLAEIVSGSVFDSNGNYYFGNSRTAEIFRYTPDSDISLFASLPINSGNFRLGQLVFFDGYIYAPGYPDNRIYRISMDGDIKIVVGPGAAGDAGSFQLNGPAGITAGNQPGEIYVTNYNSGVINRIQLDTLSDTTVTQPAGLSGLWYDPALDGEGYNIIYTTSGLLVYFYGYNDQGERIWLISDLYSGELNFGETVNLTFLELTGGTFAAPASPADNASVWGSLEITFNDCGTALFKIDGADGVKNSETVKLTDISGVVCE